MNSEYTRDPLADLLGVPVLKSRDKVSSARAAQFMTNAF